MFAKLLPLQSLVVPWRILTIMLCQIRIGMNMLILIIRTYVIYDEHFIFY